MPPHVPQYIDFDVQIEADGQGGYRVHVQSSAGQTHAEFQLPFSDAQLESRLLKLKMALMRSSGSSNRAVLSPEEQAVQDFGQGLFEALMTANVRSLYDVSRNQAAGSDKGVRLRLQVSAPEIASLPWEFLYDARQRVYLCRQKDTPLVRYLEVSAPVPTLTVDAPLRILAMIASPNDLHQLDTEREKRRMEQSLARLTQAGQIELVWVSSGHWRDLQRALWHGPWHVFHYIGHGGFDTRIDEGVLAFEGDDGRMQPIRARDLADLLSGERHLRFAFLNACLGAAGGERDVFASTAATLVQRGTPAVLAMQYEITDKAAIEFGQTFYEALADGLPVDTAATMARQAIHFGVPNSLEWGTPVLYSRATSGALFVVNASAAPVIEVSEPIIQEAPAPLQTVKPPPARDVKPDYAGQYRAARTLYAEENYAAALDQFRALQAVGFKPPVGSLETRIAEIESILDEQQRAHEAAERAAQREMLYAELQDEVGGARSAARKAEVRDALTRFMADFPEYGDPAGLAEKLNSPAPPKPVQPVISSESEPKKVEPPKPTAVPTNTPSAPSKPTSISSAQQRLLAIMLDSKRPPKERAAAGDELAKIGDPRPGVIDFDFGADYWCRVPAGRFTYQGDAKASIDADYWIGKYPITYAQYKVFLDDPHGFRDPQWWRGLHADGLAQQKKGAGTQQWPIANHPADNVSWYDAMAFCRWLSTKLGYEVTLPTEQQWEKAARGTDGREYPYSGTFDANKGNTTETGIGQTSTVGIFPDGVSPCGVLDMSGNVWEWLLTEYDGANSNKLNNSNSRVVRGGSWFSVSGFARAAARDDYFPDARYLSIGFRVSVGVRPPSL